MGLGPGANPTQFGLNSKLNSKIAAGTALSLELEPFFEQNRMEVRFLYRKVLKLTSMALPRRIEREARI